MNKIDIIRNVASEANIDKKVVSAVLDTYGKFVLDALKENRDDRIVLPGLGAFTVKHVPEKSGIVQLGATKGSEWHKDAHDELKFTVSKSVKQM